MLTVLTWYWRQPGGRIAYTAEHVNIWADMVRRNLSRPHRLACVTDLRDGLDPRIEIIEPPREFEDWRIPSWGPKRPQCLRRIAMFAPDAASRFGDRFVCMDLDCIVAGPLDPLFETDAEFKMFAGTAFGRPYNGSMMLIKAGARRQVYDRFTLEGAIKAGKNFIGSDQAWISHCLGPNEAKWTAEDGAVWWKDHVQQPCRVMFFPGLVKPWRLVDCGDAFAVRHYRRDAGRAGLILGYGSHIWTDLAEVIDRRFDGVIASPEAARLWPGELVGIARDDDHADRMATMHGFSEIAFCGRSQEGMTDGAVR